MLMITMVRTQNDEIISNIFVIAITILVYPSFLISFTKKQKNLVRLEWITLLFITIVSIFRFINRIDPLPVVANASIVIIIIGFCIFSSFVLIGRIMKKFKK